MNKHILLLSLVTLWAKPERPSDQALECEIEAQDALLELKRAKSELQNLRAVPAKVLILAEKKIDQLDFKNIEKALVAQTRKHALKYFSKIKKNIIKVCQSIDSNEKNLNKAIEGTSKYINDVLFESKNLDLEQMYLRLDSLCKKAKHLAVAHNKPARQLLNLEFSLITFDAEKIAQKLKVEKMQAKREVALPTQTRHVLNFANKTKVSLKLAKNTAANPTKKLASLKKATTDQLDKTLEKNNVQQNISLLAELEKEISLLGRSIDRLSSQIGFDLDSLEKFGQKLSKI